ncbi:hypothetical protein SETIT_5G377600v2 [Setaria italica]|uniref:Uncharacterized protein n=2 Tax=Setaria TaxID=4554 RepID=A0A368RD97_SETIT|nr:hypothetical protein SETIT_5G377600v2 [Setaria italica]TKW17658.1 hypothetical protein SEVIR_5G382800v2 [Setaria viridis]TKW17659.1 hypothetical protein SEVIR_5G382800v2 [Setaria viridis]TKW17660.1 hypothetical protein SEVIR_5G382800v2 [Setaria viridis]
MKMETHLLPLWERETPAGSQHFPRVGGPCDPPASGQIASPFGSRHRGVWRPDPHVFHGLALPHLEGPDAASPSLRLSTALRSTTRHALSSPRPSVAPAPPHRQCLSSSPSPVLLKQALRSCPRRQLPLHQPRCLHLVFLLYYSGNLRCSTPKYLCLWPPSPSSLLQQDQQVQRVQSLNFCGECKNAAIWICDAVLHSPQF